MRTIAIIGGGFSGTLTAVNLARFSEEPLKVVLINSRRPFGRGTAYGTARREHLLNVAARNMSAFPDIPNHFFLWLIFKHMACELHSEYNICYGLFYSTDFDNIVSLKLLKNLSGCFKHRNGFSELFFGLCLQFCCFCFLGTGFSCVL